MQATTIASNASLNDALSTFVTGVHRALRKIGKVPVVWEEMVLAHDIDLDPETIVMVWISSTHVASVVNKGFKVIHAASDYFYLDCGFSLTILPHFCSPYRFSHRRSWRLAGERPGPRVLVQVCDLGEIVQFRPIRKHLGRPASLDPRRYFFHLSCFSL